MFKRKKEYQLDVNKDLECSYIDIKIKPLFVWYIWV
jgi:hypothetical protein